MLESRTPIKYAHNLVGDTRQAGRLMKNPEAAVPQNGLDASILRTCHQLYDELLPTLYGNNCFHFEDPYAMMNLRCDGLNNERKEPDFWFRASRLRKTLSDKAFSTANRGQRSKLPYLAP